MGSFILPREEGFISPVSLHCVGAGAVTTFTFFVVHPASACLSALLLAVLRFAVHFCLSLVIRYLGSEMTQVTRENGPGPQRLSELPPVEVGRGRTVNVRDLVLLCRQASAAILDVYGQPEEEWNLEHKEGNEPLTKADLDSNKVRLYRFAPPPPLRFSSGGKKDNS